MNVLVLCGDRWHAPAVAREGLGGLAGREFALDWVDDASGWSPATMTDCDTIILTKSDNTSLTDPRPWMTDEVQAAFAEFVRRGHGLLAIHSGTADYTEAPVLRGLLGGVFDHHPEQCPVTMTPRIGHPLCPDCAPFTLRDEHYFMLMDDPHVDMFMTTTSVHGEQPAAWRREVGRGRVAVITPGHNLEVWLHPSFQRLLVNTLRWCGRAAPMNKLANRSFLFRPLTVLLTALLAAALFAGLIVLLFDGGQRWYLLYYFVPIGVPFIAFLFDRLERYPEISRTAWGIDLLVLIPSLTRAFVRLPLVSGHALFLTYTLMSARSRVARLTSFLVLLQVAYLKIFVTHDTALVGGILVGCMTAFLYRWIYSPG